MAAIKVRVIGVGAYVTKLNKIKTKANKAIRSINKVSAIEYAQMLREAITSQKYDFYELSQRYENWKSTNYPSALHFAHLVGNLLSSIYYNQKGKDWVAGINPSAMGVTKNGKAIPVLEYALYFEEGRDGQPERLRR